MFHKTLVYNYLHENRIHTSLNSLCETAHFGFRYAPFRSTIKPISGHDKAENAGRNRLFRNVGQPKRPFRQFFFNNPFR